MSLELKQTGRARAAMSEYDVLDDDADRGMEHPGLVVKDR